MHFDKLPFILILTIKRSWTCIELHFFNQGLHSGGVFGACWTLSALHTVSSWMCAGCGTAAHGRSPTPSQPSSTSRPTATCLQMATTWYPAVTALEARAVRPRWAPQSCSCTLLQRTNLTDSRGIVTAVMATADKCQPVQCSLCFFRTGHSVS